MSYILQALKRAERERALGDVPTLTAPFQPPAERRASLWPWVLGALFVANAAVLAYLYWPSARGPAVAETARVDRGLVSGRVQRPLPPKAEAEPMPEPRQSDAGSTPAERVSPAAEPGPQPAKNESVVETVPSNQPAPANVSVPAMAEVSRSTGASTPEPTRTNLPAVLESRSDGESVRAANQPIVLPTPTPTRSTRVAERAPAVAVETADSPQPAASDSRTSTPTQELANQILALRERPPPPEKDAPRRAAPAVPTAVAPKTTSASPASSAPLLRSMPEAFQAAVPEMRIAALMYFDDPARRVVIINGRRYREGELVDAKVPVEAITRDGVLLTYRGKTFLLPQFR